MEQNNHMCPVCGGNMSIYFKDMFDDRYGYNKLFDIYHCSACKQFETRPALKEEELPSLYSTYYPRSNIDVNYLENAVKNPASFKEKFLRWWKGVNNLGQYYIEKDSVVLDYGCGDCLSLLEIKKLGGIPYGIETDPNVKAVSEHFGLNVHIGSIFDNPFPEIKFDYIIMNQVLEHIPDTEIALDKLKSMLSDNGRIIVAVPNALSIYNKLNGRRWINWHIPYHLHHYNKKSLLLVFKKAGFKATSIKTITPNLWVDLQKKVYSETSKLGVPAGVWTGNYVEKGKEDCIKPYLFICRVLHKMKIPALYSVFLANLKSVVYRLGDLFGWGDSILVVLKKSD